MRPAVRQLLFGQYIVPLVHIDGAKGLLTDVAGGSLTNGRTSTTTYIDANGVLQTASANTLVFENGALRHEGQATNLFLRSQEFDNASWSKGNSGVVAPVVTANQVTAPDGTLTGDKIDYPAISVAGNFTIVYQQPVGQVNGSPHTFLVWLKGAVGNESIYIISTESASGPFTKTLCTLTTQWQRFSVMGTKNATNLYWQIGVDLRDGTQTGKSAQTIYAWGAQLETGSYATSYIQTTTAAASRAIDSIKLPEVLNSNLYQNQGITLVKLKTRFANSAGNKSIFSYNTGSTDFIYDNGSGGIAMSDGTNTATAAVGGWAANDTLLIASCRNAKNGLMSIHVSKNGGAWVDSSDTTYDGAVATGSNIVLASGSTAAIEFNTVKTYKTNKSFTKMQQWIKAKAAQEVA